MISLDQKIAKLEAELEELKTERQKRAAEDAFIRYMATVEGFKLANQLNTYGLWQVFGENSFENTSTGIPGESLGFFRGKLVDVIKHAVTLEKFWDDDLVSIGCPGEGGKIRPVKFTKIYGN